MHFYAWERGLKTGMYYLRTKAATDAIKFTVEKKYNTQAATLEAESVAIKAAAVAENAPTNYQAMSDEEMAKQQAAISCSLDNPDSCEMCSG